MLGDIYRVTCWCISSPVRFPHGVIAIDVVIVVTVHIQLNRLLMRYSKT